MPSRRRVRITRTEISARLATNTVSNISSHPEDAVGDGFQRGVGTYRKGKPDTRSGSSRIDDAVIPQAGGRIVGVALVLVLLADGRLERLLLIRRPRLTGRGQLLTAHGGQHRRSLLATHHRDPRIGPHPQEARRIGPPAHRI